MDLDKPKNCPFCNSNDLRVIKTPITTQCFKDVKMYETTVSCNNCGVDGPKRAYVENVQDAWDDK